MNDFKKYLSEQLENPEFKLEWDQLEVEYSVIKTMLKARQDKNITQKQLADLTGITQADISRIENGNANPSLHTLQRLAKGLGMIIKLEFVPLSTK